MNVLRDRFALLIATISLIVSLVLVVNRPDSSTQVEAGAADKELAEAKQELAEMRELVGRATVDLEDLKHAIGAIQPAAQPTFETDGNNPDNGDGAAAIPFVSIDQRIGNLEISLAKLRSNYEGISVEGASEERAKLFASAEGALKADEYYEAGKFSIAAEGYLTYLRNNPDDADSRNIMGRARRAYQRAGYDDMAIWVQEQVLENFPENRVVDLKQLAEINKSAGRYDEAISHAAESAELDTNSQSRLWTRLYWAWYNQLRDGPAAGLDAHRQVQQEIVDSGFADHRLYERSQEKIAAIEKELAATR